MNRLIVPGVTMPTMDQALLAGIYETSGPGTRIQLDLTGFVADYAFVGVTLNAFEVDPRAGAVRLP